MSKCSFTNLIFFFFTLDRFTDLGFAFIVSLSLENLYTLNFNALPRFYPMMVLPTMLVRMRSIDSNMRNVLKRVSLISN